MSTTYECVPRYVFDEHGINLTLQAAGAVIRDSFNDLGTRGCQIRNQFGETVPWKQCLNKFLLLVAVIPLK